MGLLGFIMNKAADMVRDEEETEMSKKHASIIYEKWNEIVKQLVDGVTIVEIAEKYLKEHQIPENRTILLLSKGIQDWADSDDQELKEIGYYIISKQYLDVTIDPLAYIQQLHNSKSVFFTAECKGYRANNKFSSVEGIILLCKPFIYYFPISADDFARKQFSVTKESIKSQLSEGVEQIFPVLGVLGAGLEVLGAINDSYKDFFDEDRKKILVSLMQSGEGVAIPIHSITRLRRFEDDNKNNFLHVRFRHSSASLPDNMEEDIYFRPMEDKDQEKVKEWISAWHSYLRIVAVSEGIYFKSK